MADPKSSCSTGGRRRHRTKKHKRHSRRRHTRGGFTAPSYQGALGPGINAPAWNGPSVSGSQPVVSGYDGAPSTMKAYGGGRRRSRNTRRHPMRGGDAFSPMGGDGKGGVTATWNGNGIGGVALSGREYSAGTNR